MSPKEFHGFVYVKAVRGMKTVHIVNTLLESQVLARARVEAVFVALPHDLVRRQADVPSERT